MTWAPGSVGISHRSACVAKRIIFRGGYRQCKALLKRIKAQAGCPLRPGLPGSADRPDQCHGRYGLARFLCRSTRSESVAQDRF